MSPTSDPSEKNRTQYAFNIALATVAGLVGCLTLLIVLVALFGGLWLDSWLDTRPMFTVGLMIASVPVTLVAMFWVVRKATSQIRQSSNQNSDQSQEEAKSGRNT
jgi:F0F1-type ATP synthase assembly protein I